MNVPEHPRREFLLRALAVVEAIAILVMGIALFVGGDEGLEKRAALSPLASDSAESSARVPLHAERDTATSSAEHEENFVEPAKTSAKTSDSAPESDHGVLLFGRCISDDGRVLDKATGWISLENETARLATFEAQAGGSFAIAGLPAGRLRVHVRASQHAELDEVLDLGDGIDQHERDLVLQRTWTVALKIVTPEGVPLHHEIARLRNEQQLHGPVDIDAIATAWPMEGDFETTRDRKLEFGIGRWQSRTGDSDGARLRVGADYAGIFDFSERRQVWISAVLRHCVLASAAVEPGQSELTLVVPLERVLGSLSTVRLRVLHESSALPMPDVAVRLHLGFGVRTTQSDAAGIAELRHVMPGIHSLSIKDGATQAFGAEIQVERGVDLDLGDLRLGEFRQIRVRCEGVQGEARRLRMTAEALAASLPSPLQPSRDVLTPHEGGFVLIVPEGRYLLHASGAGAAVMEVDTRSYVDQPIVVQLGAEALLRVQVADGDEIFRLFVHDDQDRILADEMLKSTRQRRISLPLGTYRIVTRDRRGAKTERNITIGSAGLDLRVPE